MTPQYQEFPTHDPENGIYGDCFRGALASILDLPISEVPHFARNHPDDEVARQKAIDIYLASKGFYLFGMDYLTGVADIERVRPKHAGGYYHLIMGIDFDGDGHACVGFNGKLVHDPNPSQKWLANPPSEWKIGLFMSTMHK